MSAEPGAPAPHASAERVAPFGPVASAQPVAEAAPVLVTDLASKTLAVKEGETFLYTDLEGNLDHGGDYGLGLYSRDTRFLSLFRMRISGRDAVLLSSSAERAYMSYVDLTNPDLYEGERVAVRQQTLNVRRIRAVNERLFERIRVKNYNAHPVEVDLQFELGADFADIFEVRGMASERRPAPDRPLVEDRRVTFSALGRDGIRRSTVIEFTTAPDEAEVEQAIV